MHTVPKVGRIQSGGVDTHHRSEEIKGIEQSADDQCCHGDYQLAGYGHGRSGKQQLGHEAHETGNADHAERACGEGQTRQAVSVPCTGKAGKFLAASGYGFQTVGGQKQQGFGEGVGDDVEDGGHGSFGGAKAQTHVDVADLRRGGEGDHTVDVVLFDGAEGAHDHAQDTEDEHDVGEAGFDEDIKADDAINDLDEHQNVGFGDQAGQDRAGAGGGGAVGVGHPEMEGEAAAFNGQTQGDQRGGHNEGHHVVAGLGDEGELFLDVGDQQVAGDVVQQNDADEEQTGAQQAEDHVTGGGGGGASDLTDHQQTTGGQS